MLNGTLVGKPIDSTKQLTPPTPKHVNFVVISHMRFLNGASKKEFVGVFVTDEQYKFAQTSIKMGYTTVVAFSTVGSTYDEVYKYNKDIAYVVIADKLG